MPAQVCPFDIFGGLSLRRSDLDHMPLLVANRILALKGDSRALDFNLVVGSKLYILIVDIPAWTLHVEHGSS
jgi:hypothetical protein